MGVDTEEFSCERITQGGESCQRTGIFQYFYVGYLKRFWAPA